MSVHHQKLIPEGIYHIYSRATGWEKLFLSDENYRFFLSKIRKYLLPVVEIYTWALLPNHFHLLLRIKNLNDLESHYLALGKRTPFKKENADIFLTQCFSNMLNSYTKSFNKVYNRKGSLFIDNFRRKSVLSDTQFGVTAFYIHKNPVHHGYCDKMEDWKWSSYRSYLNKEPAEESSKELMSWFGGVKGFMQYHSQRIDTKSIERIER